MGQYSDPYPTGDPNKTDEQVDVEAALAWAKLRRRERPEDICKELGISRRTFYRRIDALILAQDRPSRSVMQLLAEEELDDIARIAHSLLTRVETGDVSVADATRLLSEIRQINASKRRLYAVDDAGPETPTDEPAQLPEHLRAAARAAEDEIARREAEIRADGAGA